MHGCDQKKRSGNRYVIDQRRRKLAEVGQRLSRLTVERRLEFLEPGVVVELVAFVEFDFGRGPQRLERGSVPDELCQPLMYFSDFAADDAAIRESNVNIILRNLQLWISLRAVSRSAQMRSPLMPFSLISHD